MWRHIQGREHSALVRERELSEKKGGARWESARLGEMSVLQEMDDEFHLLSYRKNSSLRLY